MDVQNLYNELTSVAIRLYRNQEQGINDLVNIKKKLEQFISEVTVMSDELVIKLLNCFSNLLEALENNDKLFLADIIYYDICELIIDYANANHINIKYDKSRQRMILENEIDEIDKIYNKNVKCLTKMENDFYRELIDFCTKFDINDEKVVVDAYRNIAVFEKNRWWRLNSFYNSKKAAEIGKKEIEGAGYISMLFIFGMGNGDYIRKIAEIVPTDTLIFIYEPNKSVFGINIYYNDWTDILERDNVFLFVKGINDDKMDTCVYVRTDNISYKFLHTYILPGYDVLYRKEIEDRIEACNILIRDAVLTDNTIDKFAEHFNYNRIMNLPLIYESILLTDLKKFFQQYVDFEHIPAIIMAAGPSLDKSIDKLKSIKGKAFVLAVDSAIRMCVKHSVVPDAIVTIDPQKQDILFHNEVANKTPLFFSTSSIYKNIKDLQGKKVFCYTEDFVPTELENRIELISAGGSVANTAFSIISYLGFKKIIAIGLDLAFLGEKKHASTVYDDGGINNKKEKYTEVKGQNGEMLLTYPNFIAYKEQFESKIKENKDKFEFINSSEGGAYIEGADHMPLDKAIEKYCGQDVVDFEEIFRKCPESFTKEEKESKRKYLENYIMQCDEIKEYYQDCCTLYKKMIESKDIKEVKQMMKKVDNLYLKASSSFVGKIIIDYSSKEADRQLDQMYQKDKEQGADMKAVIEKGIMVSEIFMRKSEQAKKVFFECLKTL